MSENTTGVVRYRVDGEIVTLTLDDPDAPVNVMNDAYVTSMRACVDRIEAEREQLRGVIITSGKRSFCAGGDLVTLRASSEDRVDEERDRLDGIKRDLRRLERLGRPVVALVNGSAFGGGLELALACHRRIAVDDRTLRVGLPEVGLGLLPGAGGTVRLTRMLGIEDALRLILPVGAGGDAGGSRGSSDDGVERTPGSPVRMDAAAARERGILDEIAPDADAADARAREWIAQNPAPVAPWDEPGFRIPGGTSDPQNPAAALPAWIAAVHAEAETLPAPRAALAAVVEGALVDADTASQVETRYFLHLSHTDEARRLIDAFFDRQRVDADAADARADVAAAVEQSALDEAIAAVREGGDPEVVGRAARCAGWLGGVLGRVDTRALEPGEGDPVDAPFDDLVDRMLIAPALAALRVQREHALPDADTNVASIDAGFPAATGGAARFVAAFAGGPSAFAERTAQLEAAYGARFAPPA